MVPAVAMSAAERVAFNCVALTKVAGLFVPFHVMAAELAKPVPVTVRSKPVLPATIVLGESDISEGAAGLMVKFNWLVDRKLPCTTSIAAVPAVAMSAAVIEAVSCVELTTVVGRTEPFHATEAPDRKPVPLTVSVKAASPDVTVAGDKEEREGGVGGGLEMVKVEELEVLPLLVTVTCAVPEFAISAAAMLAVTWVPLTKLVVRADPFHCTMAPFENPVPFTVRVNAPEPTTALERESEVMAGAGELPPQPVSANMKRIEIA